MNKFKKIEGMVMSFSVRTDGQEKVEIFSPRGLKEIKGRSGLVTSEEDGRVRFTPQKDFVVAQRRGPLGLIGPWDIQVLEENGDDVQRLRKILFDE